MLHENLLADTTDIRNGCPGIGQKFIRLNGSFEESYRMKLALRLKNPSKCHGVSKTPVLRPFRGVTFGWSGVSIGGVGILRVSNFLGYQLRFF